MDESISSDLIALAKKLNHGSFKPLSDGIGLVSFKQTASSFSWEPSSPVAPVAPVQPMQEVTKYQQVEKEKPIVSSEKSTKNLFQIFLKFLLSHLIDMIFVLSLLWAIFLGVDFFFYSHQDSLEWTVKMKEVIFNFPKEWGSFLISLDGLLVAYLLFFIYLIFFKFTAGGSIGSLLITREKR